jgi:hypothetical protein
MPRVIGLYSECNPQITCISAFAALSLPVCPVFPSPYAVSVRLGELADEGFEEYYTEYRLLLLLLFRFTPIHLSLFTNSSRPYCSPPRPSLLALVHMISLFNSLSLCSLSLFFSAIASALSIFLLPSFEIWIFGGFSISKIWILAAKTTFLRAAFASPH